MNKNILIGFLIVSVLISGCTAPETQTQTQTQPAGGTPAITTNPEQEQAAVFSVEIKNFTFIPETITISKGETVRWTQLDAAPHTITTVKSDVIKSPSLNKGQTYSHTFTETGTFEYYCSIHPSMKGKVIVN